MLDGTESGQKCFEGTNQMYRTQYLELAETFRMKPSAAGLLLGILIALLVILFVVIQKPGLEAAPLKETGRRGSDPLWAKAVAIAGRNDRWVSRSFTEDERVYDSAGDLEATTLSTFSVSGKTKATLKARVETSVKNGVNNKAKRSEELAKTEARDKKKAGGNKDEAENPFAPANQSRLTVRALPAEKNTTIDGRTFRAFAFTQTTDEGIWDGVAWLDESSGIPGRLVSKARVATLPEPTDPEEKRFRLRSLRVTVNFQTKDVRQWRASSLRVDMEITIRIAPLLTFEGRVRNTYRFSKYERLAG